MANQTATRPLHLDMDGQIECAQTLASRFYTDPAILEIEKPRIFQRTWQLVGTLGQSCGEANGVKQTISDPESYFTAEVAGEPIIVVRDKQGELRAFSNVCRHRAGPIALGSGCKNVLRCQYHGWTYTLDGKLIGTPDVEGVEMRTFGETQGSSDRRMTSPSPSYARIARSRARGSARMKRGCPEAGHAR